nr:MAG TPA: GTP-binding protein GEM, small GTPase, GDP, inactive [Caudoviricetes sp.]
MGTGISSPSSSSPNMTQPSSSRADNRASLSSTPLVAASRSGKTTAISWPGS